MIFCRSENNISCHIIILISPLTIVDSRTTNVCLNHEPIGDESRCRVFNRGCWKIHALSLAEIHVFRVSVAICSSYAHLTCKLTVNYNKKRFRWYKPLGIHPNFRQPPYVFVGLQLLKLQTTFPAFRAAFKVLVSGRGFPSSASGYLASTLHDWEVTRGWIPSSLNFARTYNGSFWYI